VQWSCSKNRSAEGKRKKCFCFFHTPKEARPLQLPLETTQNKHARRTDGQPAGQPTRSHKRGKKAPSGGLLLPARFDHFFFSSGRDKFSSRTTHLLIPSRRICEVEVAVPHLGGWMRRTSKGQKTLRLWRPSRHSKWPPTSSPRSVPTGDTSYGCTASCTAETHSSLKTNTVLTERSGPCTQLAGAKPNFDGATHFSYIRHPQSAHGGAWPGVGRLDRKDDS